MYSIRLLFVSKRSIRSAAITSRSPMPTPTMRPMSRQVIVHLRSFWPCNRAYEYSVLHHPSPPALGCGRKSIEEDQQPCNTPVIAVVTSAFLTEASITRLAGATPIAYTRAAPRPLRRGSWASLEDDFAHPCFFHSTGSILIFSVGGLNHGRIVSGAVHFGARDRRTGERRLVDLRGRPPLGVARDSRAVCCLRAAHRQLRNPVRSGGAPWSIARSRELLPRVAGAVGRNAERYAALTHSGALPRLIFGGVT
jgi:hypothetical protein